MLRGPVVILAMSGIVAGCGNSTSTSTPPDIAASCAGTRLSVTPSVAHAGGTVRVAGSYFAADCYDMGQPGTPPPLRGLSLHLWQHDKTWTVASGVDASGRHYGFQVPIRIPAAVRPGFATVTVQGYGSAKLIRIAPGKHSAEPHEKGG